MPSISFIFELTKRDFAERFAGSLLGALWVFIWPIVNLFIYIVVFGNLMGARLPGTSNMYSYGVYLTSGLIAWVTFSQVITRCSTIFLEKKNLISKVRITLPSLLFFVVSAETVTYLLSMGIFFLFLVVTDYPLSRHLILWPFIYFLQTIFALGIGILAATFSVFLRDLKEVVGITLQLWFWFTPIVYVPEILPEVVRQILVLNPIYVFIDAYHRIFVLDTLPNCKSLVVMTLFSHLLVWVAYIVFRKLEKDVRDFL